MAQPVPMAAHNHLELVSDDIPGVSDVLFWPLWALHAVVLRHTCTPNSHT